MKEYELVNYINQYLDKHGIRYKNEVHMGIGLPDVSINLGANKNQAKINDYYLFLIIEYIKDNRYATPVEIRKHFNFSQERTQKYINTLIAKNIIKSEDSKLSISRNVLSTKLGTIISIEAKLKDWRGGLLQAKRYMCFSDYSYLALRTDKICNVNQQLFEDAGIGLLSVDNHEIKEIIKPKLSSECDYYLKYLLTSSILSEYENSLKKRKKDEIFSQYHSLYKLDK